ncbi:MAG: GAF domain-containing protein, partial [Armatimonadetes bacterium]|nr:GAF domain-containing protein [Armatimonadota bacterium]
MSGFGAKQVPSPDSGTGADRDAFGRLHNAVVAISKATSYSAAFELAVDAALDVTGSESALITLVQGGRIEIAFHRNIPEHALAKAAAQDLSKTFLRRVIVDAEAIAFTPADHGDPSLHGGHPGGGAICAVPVVYHNEVLGAVAVRRSEDRPYGPSEVLCLATLGAVVGAVAANRAAVNAAREAEARLSSVLRWLPGTTFVLDPDGCLQYASPSFRTLTGQSEDRLLGRPLWDFVHPEDADAVREELARARGAPDRSFDFHYRGRDVFGRWALYRAWVGPLYDLDSKLLHDAEARPSGFVAYARDVSDEQARRVVLEAVPAVYSALRSAATVDELFRLAVEAIAEHQLGRLAAVWVPDDSGLVLGAAWIAGVGPLPGRVSSAAGLAAQAAAMRTSHEGTIADEPSLAAVIPSALAEGLGFLVAEPATLPEEMVAVLEIAFSRDDPRAPHLKKHTLLLASHLAIAASELQGRMALEQANKRLTAVAAELQQKT